MVRGREISGCLRSEIAFAGSVFRLRDSRARVLRTWAPAQVTLDRRSTLDRYSHDQNLPPRGRKTEPALGQQFSSHPSFPLPPPNGLRRGARSVSPFSSTLCVRPPLAPCSFCTSSSSWVGDTRLPTPPTSPTGVAFLRGEKESGASVSLFFPLPLFHLTFPPPDLSILPFFAAVSVSPPCLLYPPSRENAAETQDPRTLIILVRVPESPMLLSLRP